MKKDQKEKAFEAMVQAHKSTAYSVCYMFAASSDEANDLFQEVLINLWKGFDSFRADSSPQTWVYRVSLNTCISAGRKKTVRTERLGAGMEPSAYEVLDNNPQNRMLHERIHKLDPFDRAIVLLCLKICPTRKLELLWEYRQKL